MFLLFSQNNCSCSRIIFFIQKHKRSYVVPSERKSSLLFWTNWFFKFAPTPLLKGCYIQSVVGFVSSEWRTNNDKMNPKTFYMWQPLVLVHVLVCWYLLLSVSQSSMIVATIRLSYWKARRLFLWPSLPGIRRKLIWKYNTSQLLRETKSF